jgi:hypothetical protein
MRWFASLVLALALAVMGCSEASDPGGTGGDGGSAGHGGAMVACVDNVCPCSEAGIRAAIAEGGGPFTFDCDGPTNVVLEAEIHAFKDVTLDGEGNLIVDGSQLCGGVFHFSGDTDLRNLTIRSADGEPCDSKDLIITIGAVSGSLTLTGVEALDAGIWANDQTTLRETTLSGVLRIGGRATITNSTLGNIFAEHVLMNMQNSTVAGRFYMSDSSALPSSAVLTNCTLVNDEGLALQVIEETGTISVRAAGTIIMGGCDIRGTLASDGYNIESDGNTCRFDQPTDQVNVSADDLKLGPLQDNSGPTMTHALGEGSVAIDVIPAVDCVDADGAPLTTDQRGEPRDSMCDVGAFEVQP